MPDGPGPAGDSRPRPRLDWRDRRHWGGHLAPCIHCRKKTPLRDESGAPSHKVCAEREAFGLSATA